MALKIDDNHYSSVVELYTNQINTLEQDIEDFKATCDLLFANNNFGAYLQEVLQEMYLNFYSTANEQLKALISAVDTSTSIFLDDIETSDKF